MRQPFKVTIMDLTQPTPSGRKYPPQTIIHAIKEANWNVPILFATDLQPFGDDPANFTGIPIDRICGFADNLMVEGDELTATINFKNTPMGTIASQLVEANCTLDYRVFGFGSTLKEGEFYYIQQDYVLAAVAIHDPNKNRHIKRNIK